MFALKYFDMGTCFYMFEQKNENFLHFIHEIHWKTKAIEIINSLICIHSYRLFKKCFVENSKFHYSLFFIEFTHQIFTVLFEI